MLNQVPLLSTARNPRAIVKINEHVIKKIDYIEYIENNFYLSDTFHVKLPLYNLDDAVKIEYWMSQPAIMVELFAGFPKDPQNYGTQDLENLILGGINNVDVRVFENGAGIVEFDGFDLSKKFVDNKTIEKYPNRTSSEIAIILATKRGLKYNVTTTNTLVGVYYSQDYVQLNTETTEWDLLVYLAQKEGFGVFVRGQTLYFQPRPDNSSNPYLLQAQTLENNKQAILDGVSLTVSRNFYYARDVIVKIRSWNATTGRVEAEARATPNKKTALAAAAQPIGEAQVFEYSDRRGLTKQQALDLAQKLLQDITLHERLLEARLPGDNKLRKNTIIQLKGVSPSADQIYYPDTITRMITSEMYSMEVRAKNHSPASTILA